MDSLKFDPGPPCPTLLRPTGLTAFLGLACPKDRQPAAVFYPFGHPMPYAYEVKLKSCHGCISRGDHGLFKVSPAPTMPCPSTLYMQPPLIWPYSRLRGDRQQSGRPAVIFYPFGHPTPYDSRCCSSTPTALSWLPPALTYLALGFLFQHK
jgi:hypothetical protein